MSTTIIERIKKEIESLDTTTHVEEVGTVTAVLDGVAEIEGLQNAQMMEMILFDTGSTKSLAESLDSERDLFGLVLNLEEEVVKVVVLGETGAVREGMTVKRTGRLLSVPVSEEIIGRVVSPLGEPLDGRGA